MTIKRPSSEHINSTIEPIPLRARFEIGFLTELLVFVVLGIIWIVSLKRVFPGVGQADPDAGE